MDLLFWSSMLNVSTPVLHTYDIACQWSKNLFRRAQAMPPEVRPALTPSQVRFRLPKMHAQAHGWSCQTEYSLGFTEGAAMTDGEGIERNWSSTNTIAPTTQHMGPGHRRDTLDDVFQFHNFKKWRTLGALSLLFMLLESTL
jgi:hypothetical protein